MAELTIGRVAERAGVGVETVRFYEREGLIEQPARPRSGYRKYPERVVSELRFIRRSQELGFSLREIDELMSLRLAPEANSADIKLRAEAKIAEIEEKIADLQRMRDALQRLAAACDGERPVEEYPILEALDTESSRTPVHADA